MQSRTFQDFDAFAHSIHSVESRMMLRNPRHRTWRLSVAELSDIQVQLGQLGDGNVVFGAGLLTTSKRLTEGLQSFADRRSDEQRRNQETFGRRQVRGQETRAQHCRESRAQHWCGVGRAAHNTVRKRPDEYGCMHGLHATD